MYGVVIMDELYAATLPCSDKSWWNAVVSAFTVSEIKSRSEMPTRRHGPVFIHARCMLHHPPNMAVTITVPKPKTTTPRLKENIPPTFELILHKGNRLLSYTKNFLFLPSLTVTVFCIVHTR